MFNAEVEKVYDTQTVAEFKRFAEKMEGLGIKVVLCCPDREVQGQVFPNIVGIDTDSYYEDYSEELYEIYERLTENRPYFDSDYGFICAADYKEAKRLVGGIELWVK